MLGPSQSDLVVIGKVTETTANILFDPVAASFDVKVVQESSGDVVQTVTVAPREGEQRPAPVVVALEGLREDTRYLVINEDDYVVARFATFPGGTKRREVEFLVVSCDNPELEGVKDAWLEVWTRVKTGKIDVIFHIGDQIYGDKVFRKHVKTKHFSAEKALEDYRALYRKSWGENKYKNLVLRSVSNVMVCDDHDVVDAWNRRPEHYAGRMQQVAEAGETAFREYQRSLFTGEIGEDSTTDGYHLWQYFACAGVLVFAIEHRTTGLENMISADQMADLALCIQKYRPERVVFLSPVPPTAQFVGAYKRVLRMIFESDTLDSWTPEESRLLYDTLATANVPTLIVSGDQHLALCGTVKVGDVIVPFCQIGPMTIGTSIPYAYRTLVGKGYKAAAKKQRAGDYKIKFDGSPDGRQNYAWVRVSPYNGDQPIAHEVVFVKTVRPGAEGFVAQTEAKVHAFAKAVSFL